MLKYSLLPMERAFAFQILEQSGQIKDAINYVGGSFYSSNGWVIKVSSSPEIKVPSRTIFLRGSHKEQDLRVDRTWNFLSNIERDETISAINQALAEIISFASGYEYRYQVGPQAVLGVFNTSNTVIGTAPEVVTLPEDSTDTEEGWGANRLKHSRPIFQG